MSTIVIIIMCVSRSDKSHTCLFSRCQVKAFDKDPPDNGGTITYTFVSAPGERPKFSIDSQTGEITTRHVSITFILCACIYIQTLSVAYLSMFGLEGVMQGQGNYFSSIFRIPFSLPSNYIWVTAYALVRGLYGPPVDQRYKSSRKVQENSGQSIIDTIIYL